MGRITTGTNAGSATVAGKSIVGKSNARGSLLATAGATTDTVTAARAAVSDGLPLLSAAPMTADAAAAGAKTTNTTLYEDAPTGVMDAMVTEDTLMAKEFATIATRTACEAGVKGLTAATNTRD